MLSASKKCGDALRGSEKLMDACPDIHVREPVYHFMLCVKEGKEIVSIGVDGKVTLGEGVEVDEAAHVFWDAVERIAMTNMRPCPHCGRGMGD